MIGEPIKLGNLPALRKPAQGTKSGQILYLHGGGLIYGSAADYPETSARRLTALGFDLVSVAYPLAPETPLDRQIEAVVEAIERGCADGSLDGDALVAMGRSGGSFLWVAVMAQLAECGLLLPDGFVSLYGYGSLGRLLPWSAAPDYRPDVSVSEETVFGLIQQEPVFEDTAMQRMLLYIFEASVVCVTRG